MNREKQQILAAARGILANPILQMIDKLLLGLAPVLVLDFLQSLVRLQEQGLLLMRVEQNVQMALAVSDDAYVPAQGKVELHSPNSQ